jgi:hypothetical protein
MFRAQRKGFTTAIVVSLLACFAAADAQSARNAETPADAKLNAAARLISGSPEPQASPYAFARTPAWREHSEFMRAAWARLNDRQVAAMTAWRKAELPQTCPAGRTLLYPFSGPDFFNAYWLFPRCETIVMFGLEHIGEVPNIEAMNERAILLLLADVRTAMTSFLERNYFITDSMARQLRTSQLHGVLPVFMLSMALTGVDIVRIVPHELAPLSHADAVPAGKPMRNLKGVTIEFRAPGSTTTQRVHYFTVDATDQGLAHYPEFLAFVRNLAPTTTFIKSASYLLHSNKFRQMRSALLDISDFVVQDDSGLPYAMLDKHSWRVQLHGRYERPIRPFGGAFQDKLDRAYKAQHPAPLPFTFGYQYHDFRDARSNLIVARRTLVTAQLKADMLPSPLPNPRASR